MNWESRLAALEQDRQDMVRALLVSNRRWRAICTTAIVALIALFSAGPAPADKHETVVERLKLVDARGLTHAELAVGKTATTLSFLDQNGHVRTVLGVTDTGLPALTMFDKDGATRMYLSVRDKTNMAAIQFVGPDKKVNFAVTAEETGDASLSLANGRQKGGIMLGFLENGEPRLWVTDTTGKIVTALP